MNLVAIVTVILNLCFVEIFAYERGLYSKRVTIPAKVNETVQYHITHPTTSEFGETDIFKTWHHDLTAQKAALKWHSIDDKQGYLESKPGQGIGNIITFIYNMSNKSKPIPTPNTVHKIMVPCSEFAVLKDTVRLIKNDGEIINIIRVNVPNGVFNFKIVQGGIGFTDVIIVIETLLNHRRSELTFTLA